VVTSLRENPNSLIGSHAHGLGLINLITVSVTPTPPSVVGDVKMGSQRLKDL
jgi:hypothetical protein